MTRTLLLSSVLSVCAVAGAHAATVSYTGTTGVVSSTGSLSLQKFDTGLGTLSSIKIDWDSGFSARFVAGPELPGGSGTVQGLDGFVTSTTASVSTPAGTNDVTLIANAGSAFSVSVPPIYQQIVSGGDAATETYGALAAFMGVGTVFYDFVGNASDFTGGSNGIARGIQDYLFLVNAEITYTYDINTPTVPLPAGLPLLAAGLGLFGLVKRRSSRG